MTITRYPRIPIPAPGRPRSFIFSSTVDQKFALGTRLELDDGRIFRYGKNGGVILYKALMSQAEAPTGGWSETVNASGATYAVGTTSLVVTTTTAVYAHDLDDGWLLVQDVTAAALGDMYRIASHTAHATAPVITIADPGGLRTEIVVGTELTLIMNRFREVVVSVAGASANKCTGVPLVDIPISYFGWLQTRGPCPLIVDTDTILIGDPVGESSGAATNGGCGLLTSIATDVVWGTVMYIGTGGVTDEPAIIDLCLE